jgi:hypothetical protein
MYIAKVAQPEDQLAVEMLEVKVINTVFTRI